MKVIEFEAKSILKDQGMPVPKGSVILTPEDAYEATRVLGCPVVLKAQIPSGGRMKSGGVRFANTPTEAKTVSNDLLGCKILGFQVDCVLLEKRLEAISEVFIGTIYNTEVCKPMLLASTAGGIDVDETAEVVRRTFSPSLPMDEYQGREVALELGFEGQQLLHLGALITQTVLCFNQLDALLLEFNPLVLDRYDQWWIADVHLELDDNAAYRHTELRTRLTLSSQFMVTRPDFENRAVEIDSADHRGVAGRVIPFEGSLGLIIGGGGASLTIFDAILDAGLEPANYCEIGGNPSVWKIKELTKLILSQPRVEKLAVIMNTVSNTRTDLVARGVIKGILELGRDPQKVITVFRVPGSWQNEGHAILRHYCVSFYGSDISIDEVVEKITWQS